MREVDTSPGGSELAPGCFVTTTEPCVGSVRTLLQDDGCGAGVVKAFVGRWLNG